MPPARWIAYQTTPGELCLRAWDQEYVVHQALSNDTLRLTASAGQLLELLTQRWPEPTSTEDLCRLSGAPDPSAIEAVLHGLANAGLVMQC